MEKLSKYLPISELGDDFWISSYDTVTFGYKISFPEVYTISENEFDELTNTLLHAFERLGKNVIIQKYGVFFEYGWRSEHKTESKTSLWNNMHYEKRTVMDVEHYIFISFYFGKENLAKINPKFSSKHLNAIKDRKFADLSANVIEEYKELLSSFEVSVGLNDNDATNPFFPVVKRLNSDEMLTFLERYLSVNYSPDGTYDYVSYDLRDGFEVGSRDISIFSMRNLPSSFNPFEHRNGIVNNPEKFGRGGDYYNDLRLPSSFLFPLCMGLPVEHLVCETFLILDSEKVEAVLEQEKNELRFLVGLGRGDALDKSEIITNFVNKTSKDDMVCCKYGLSIIVPHLKEDRINTSTNILDIGASRGIKLYREKRGDLKAFMFNVPGSGHCLSNLKIGWLDNYIKMIHYESFKSGNNEGIPFVDVFGKPFIFDFWDDKEKYLNARNGVLFAPTGAGKSFLVNHILDSCFHQGDNIFIIDVGGSYIRTTEINEGLYFDSNDIKSFRFNPFLSCYKSEETGNFFPSKNILGEDDPMFRNFLISTIIAIWYYAGKDKNDLRSFKLADGVYATIQSSINDFYDHVNEKGILPSFDAYYSFIENYYSKTILENGDERFFDVKLFLKNTEAFTAEGEYGFLLNAETPIDLENRWVCFELDKIKDNNFIKSPVMLILVNAFQNQLDKLTGSRMRFFIDEAVDFLDLPMFGDFIGELYRKIRKKGGQIVICTQSVRYLDNIDPLIANSIYSNSPIRILLDHSSDKDAVPILQKKLSLSDAETELLNNLKVEQNRPFRYFFMKFGNMPGFVARNEVSERTFTAYQTKAEYIHQINEIKERTGSLYSAIETFVESKN